MVLGMSKVDAALLEEQINESDTPMDAWLDLIRAGKLKRIQASDMDVDATAGMLGPTALLIASMFDVI